MTTYSYPALLTQQTPTSPPIVLFAAPCTEIELWAGIPQKRRFSGGGAEETVGFQREDDPERIKKLGQFYADSKNVIQNSILCTARTLDTAVVSFEASTSQTNPGSQLGTLKITPHDLSTIPFVELLGRVRSYIEGRVPDLRDQSPSPVLIDRLKRQANQEGHVLDASLGDQEVSNPDGDIDGDSDAADEAGSGGDPTGVLFEETHIADFWEEIAARHEVAKQASLSPDLNAFLGFTRDALAAYIQPVIVVDGQHRLLGAVQRARDSLAENPWRVEVENAISSGEAGDVASTRLLRQAARNLPVSLLLTDSAAEQVFQFVVVNQKAKPIGRALLGTIVSTTLSQQELDQVANRLTSAGIPLQQSRAISYLARDIASPFYGKVQRGIDTNSKELLEWNVLGQLVSIFKDLVGGKLFGESNDYADIWRKKYLDASQIAAGNSNSGDHNPLKYWSSLDGPWRKVFVTFWTAVKSKLASADDDLEAYNAWGSPRTSNLFNKVTLTILAADFFQYLVETKQPIESAEHVSSLVDEWLSDVKSTYFSRDWKLDGVKKDSTGIRRQWAYLWNQYRKDPQRLPQTSAFKQIRGS